MALTIRKNSSGKIKYRVQIRDELGIWYPTKTFGTIREAQQYERKLKDKKDKREQAVSNVKRNIEVHNYLDEWLAHSKMTISRGWYMKVTRTIQTYILPLIAGVKLCEVRPPHIGKILGEMEKKGLKPQTRLHVYNTLSKSFKDAVEYFGYLEKSPVLKQDKPKVHRVERNFLPPDEAFKLLQHSKNHYLGRAIWLGIFTGLRPSEIQALQWKSVDFEKGQILVCAAYKVAIQEVEPYPKQKDWLIVPMPRTLAEYLQSHKGHFPLGYVAPSLEGGMLDYGKFYRGLKKLCKEVAVNRITPHELRHSCTEIWIKNGASLEDLRRLLGHKSVKTTQGYIHRTDDRLNKLAKELRI